MITATEKRIRALEAEGCSRSDAQAIVEADPHICSCCGEECEDGSDCCSDDFAEAGDIRETGR